MSKNAQLEAIEKRYSMIPYYQDYDRIEEPFRPYVMRMHQSNVALASVSTDEEGFRISTGADGKPLKREDFLSATGSPKGIVLGASTVFGVGASGDRFTIPSILNQRTKTQWMNYGVRAYNSTQETLMLLLNLPATLERLVIVSGINNLTLAFLSENTSPTYNSLFFESTFRKAFQAAISPVEDTIGAQLRRLIATIMGRRQQHSESLPAQSDEERYENVLKCQKRDFSLLAMLAKARNTEICFALQPMASFIERSPAAEETEIFQAFDNASREWSILAEKLSAYRERYRMDLRQLAEESGFRFMDLSACPELKSSDWLFVDRVHLTDRGNEQVVSALIREFNLL